MDAQLVNNRYQILKKLGEGGFGTMAAVNSTADTPAEPIPSGKFLKKFKEISMRTERNLN